MGEEGDNWARVACWAHVLARMIAWAWAGRVEERKGPTGLDQRRPSRLGGVGAVQQRAALLPGERGS
jgi:hypothetical protein